MKNRHLALLLVLLGCVSPLVAQETTNSAPDWENVQLIGIGKEPPHASMIACPTPAVAKKIRWVANDERVKSPWYLSLNGTWKFHYSTNRLGRIPDFFLPGYNDLSWSIIKVPGTMEMQGYGVPIYVNIPYPWKDATPPHVPDNDPNNTVGAYRRTFMVPKDWNGRPVYITFDGVYSFFYLWINGQKVGMSKDSRSPAEFNITKYVKPGENQIAVEVFRWCDASYVEDQDTWRMSGIYREVYVWSPPAVHVRDFEVRTDMDDSLQSATLQVSAKLQNLGPTTREVILEASLLDSHGLPVAQTNSPVTTAAAGQEIQLNLSQLVTNPLLWSAETPNRYQLLLTLKDKSLRVIEVIPAHVGFRKVEIRNGQLLVNGRVILIKGVDRHEQDLEHGFSVTPESERRDIELMKRLNINAVRTCHYPNQPSWYDMCDEYGIYLAAECNIETHAARDRGGNPTTNAAWGPAYLDRAQRNVENHKNHPSIILWSLGNESGNGINMEANYKWIKQRDQTRPVFYDDAGHASNTDLITSMYLKPWDVAKYAEGDQKRPMVLCEYAYARGNASGDLWSYWKTFYQRKHAQGAFIWDFQDRALLQPIDPDRNGAYEAPRQDGKNFWAYGGDFGPTNTPSDGNMVCNGIVGADRKLHPGALEVKHVYQNIHTKPIDLAKRTILIKNEFDFLNLQDTVTGMWRLMAEGTELFHGAITNLDIAAGQSAEIELPVLEFKPKPGVEYRLDVSFKLKRDTLWSKAGYEIAWDQMLLPDSAPRPTLAVSKMPPLNVEDEPDQLTVGNATFAAQFNKATGALVSLRKGNAELIQAPLAPHFWRAPVDNDIGYGFERIHKIWRTATEGAEVTSVDVSRPSPKVVVVRTKLNLPKASATWETTYTVYSSGDIRVDATFSPSKQDLPNLPRLGMQMRLPQGFERILWYGRGPQETYSDRKDARISAYSGLVDDQTVDYTRPSEMGNKVDVRWVALTDARGTGLLVVGSPTLSVNALHYATEDLEGKRHMYEVQRRDPITLNLDYKQMGIGGDDGWGARPHDEFQIRCIPQSYSFTLRPIAASDGDPAVMARQTIDNN